MDLALSEFFQLALYTISIEFKAFGLMGKWVNGKENHLLTVFSLVGDILILKEAAYWKI